MPDPFVPIFTTTDPPPAPPPERGPMTELYMAIVPMIACCVIGGLLAWRGDIDGAKWFLGFATGGGAAYGLQRSYVKRGAAQDAAFGYRRR